MENLYQRARELEHTSRWEEAMKTWKLLGEHEHAAACKTIKDAIDLGDRYRELVGDAHQRWENREINNSQLYEIQCEAHRRVYGN